MKKKIFFIWRGLISISRDMFTGFIMGLCAALVMLKINPGVYKAVGLLIPAGVIAGVFKGTAKFIFLSLSGISSTTGSYSYPKYKILTLWLLILTAALTAVYGVDFGQWAIGPIQILKDNVILGAVGPGFWKIVLILISAIGLFSYFYEPMKTDIPAERSECHSNSDSNSN